MLTLWVEATAEREHGRREVDQGARQRGFEVGGVVTGAAAEVEQGPRRTAAVSLEEPAIEGGLLGVVANRREQGIPVGEVAVEAGLGFLRFGVQVELLRHTRNLRSVRRGGQCVVDPAGIRDPRDYVEAVCPSS